MITKFILHGGINKQNPQDNSNFFREILKDFTVNPKILLVLFAKSPDRWLDTAADIADEFIDIRPGRGLNSKIASEENFISEVKDSDVIFFCGGVSLDLLDTLQNYPELGSVLKGKVVAGESVGANVLCKYFYSPKADRISEGLGFVPAKLIPHYIDEYAGKLDAVGQEYELLNLPEYSFRTIEVDM